MDAQVMGLMAVLLAAGAQADICRWTDANGTHFAAQAPVGVQARCQASPAPSAAAPIDDSPDVLPPRDQGMDDNRRIADEALRSQYPARRALGHQMDDQIQAWDHAQAQIDAAHEERRRITREGQDLLREIGARQ